MFPRISATEVLSWDELEEACRILRDELGSIESVVANHYDANIFAMMLANHLKVPYGAPNAKHVSISDEAPFRTDISLFKFNYEDEARADNSDVVFYRQIDIPLDRDPPLIVLPYHYS